MFRCHLLLFIAFTLASPLSLWAVPLAESISPDGQCSALLSVSPDQPSLADTVILTIDVTCSDGQAVVFPPFGETLGTLRIIDLQSTDRQLVITAIPQNAGKTPIWSMILQCGKQQIEIPETELNIVTNIDNETASLDDIGLSTEPIPAPLWYYYTLIAFLAVITLGLLRLFFKRKKIDVAEELHPLTAQEQALRRLADLLESRKHESDIKGFFVELSDIVRWYVECLTGIHAPELTTEEFLHNIAQPVRRFWGRNTSQSIQNTRSLETLAPFLESADIVKFAKHVPTNDEIMLAFRRAEHFIQQHVKDHTDSDYLSDSGTRL